MDTIYLEQDAFNRVWLELISEAISRLFRHHERVAAVAELIAREIGHPNPLECYRAGLVHDMGRLPILALTEQPRSLTDAERRIVEMHTILGAQIAQLHGMSNGVVGAVRHHHERWDGGGYPDGLRGEDIPLSARVLAVADAVVTMVENRPYVGARDVEEIIRELTSGSGSQFDPRIAEVTVALVSSLRVHRRILDLTTQHVDAQLHAKEVGVRREGG
jgi:putative nucleotidyltransferase with HDIG domain